MSPPPRRKKPSSTPSTPGKDKPAAKEDQPPSEGTEGTVTGTETTGATATKEEEAKKDPPKDPEEDVELYGRDPKKHEKLRKYLLKIVGDLLNPKYTKELYPFKFNDMVRVLTLVKNIFCAEPVMVQCRMPVVIVGDIHGQYNDLMCVFTLFDEAERKGCFNQRFVFLGDYVDRGKQSVECVMIVFVLKILFPAEFILLRGNHELRQINANYGFWTELKERFPGKDKLLFSYFNDVFSYMPLCCIAGNAILCMHGGICPEMTSRDVFKTIPKPLLAARDHIVAESLLWADPMYGEPRARPNWVRGIAVHFGEALVDEVCQNLGVMMIVRGHQMMMNGFKFFHGSKLVTVFTASHYYPEKMNNGAVMIVDVRGHIGFKVIIPPKERHGGKTFRGLHDEMNVHDDGYKTHPDILKKREAEECERQFQERERLRLETERKNGFVNGKMVHKKK